MKFVLSLLFTFLLALTSRADVVRPDERVQDGVTIRSRPSAQSAPLGLLRPADELQFEGSVPNWNRVRLTDGSTGYVSKSWTHVVAATTPGNYTIHIVDVGTGLAVVVEGRDFKMVYDGGSNDDLARGGANRLLAYVRASLPNLQTVDHLVLSHPHRDHVELLPDLFNAYAIRNVWDSGRVSPICGYRAFLMKVAVEPGVTYHNALNNFGTHQAAFPAQSCYGQSLSASTISINAGARITNDPVQLGTSGRMTFLHIDGAQHPDPNENSLVLRLDLGTTRVLFMGDAEAGARQSPTVAPAQNSIEGMLLKCCREQLRAQVLIVGHHGSMTSSRRAFLDAVGATLFIVSSGPTKYNTVTLPDQVVINELEGRGTLFRTDLNDAACVTSASKIGPDNDGKAGGCNNIRIQIGSDGAVSAAYWTGAD